MQIVVIGGGAAGFFAALAAKELNPKANTIILERSAKLLSKVRISGGGRCNVTHACFEPRLLVQNYPRGQRELLGPFHTFQPKNTIEWFKARGVILKQEEDGRMFPVSDSSSTIIDCFLKEAKKLGVEIRTQTKLHSIKKVEKGFELDIGSDKPLFAHHVILATGSSPIGWEVSKSLGHTIQAPVPSLFTFNIPSFSMSSLSGISIDRVKIKIKESKLEQVGALLITHWGFSGPAILKLSAFAARHLAERNYDFSVIIDWLPDFTEQELRDKMEKARKEYPTKHFGNVQMVSLPKNLWKKLYEKAGLASHMLMNSISKKAITKLCEILKKEQYEVHGKTTNKDEFVTCGGVTLSEVEFKTMESKLCKNLFFCGEVLDIDGITGGFNFQNAWTTGWIAGRSAAK
ncbi:MAG: NAD(P)/FAD-dependent oxidoreductase [Chlamydiota bacterium]